MKSKGYRFRRMSAQVELLVRQHRASFFMQALLISSIRLMPRPLSSSGQKTSTKLQTLFLIARPTPMFYVRTLYAQYAESNV